MTVTFSLGGITRPGSLGMISACIPVIKLLTGSLSTPLRFDGNIRQIFTVFT
jgi:hypothetical protein